MRRPLLVLLALTSFVACGDDDDDASSTTTTTEDTTTTTSSTTTTSTTTTTAAPFDGAVTPTSMPSSAAGVASLIDVVVERGAVVFQFDSEVPGFDVAYVDPPIRADASGEEVAVAGSAFLSVRMEPASGVDLAGEEFVETYTGPDRLPGTAPIAEVVRTGDFEANLTWVIGLDRQRAYRVELDGAAVRVLFDTA